MRASLWVISVVSSVLAAPALAERDETPPTAPGIPVVARRCSASSTKVTWSPSADAGGSGVHKYFVRLKLIEGDTSPEETFHPTYETEMEFDLHRDGRYVLEVIAVDHAGNASKPSVSEGFVFDRTPPPAPEHFYASPNPTRGPVELYWTASWDDWGPVTYSVVRSQEEHGTFEVVTRTSETEFSEAVLPGWYYYRVVAVDGCGNVSREVEAPRVIVER